MSLPNLVLLEDESGGDYVERLSAYIERIYGIYLGTVANSGLLFRGMPISCQRRPETYGKGAGFWHMMQEGPIEDDRTIDLNRCARVGWIAWVIDLAAMGDQRVRVFNQSARPYSWVLWLHEHNYAVILHSRSGYFLLKTAYVVKPHGAMLFERDWRRYSA